MVQRYFTSIDNSLYDTTTVVESIAISDDTTINITDSTLVTVDTILTSDTTALNPPYIVDSTNCIRHFFNDYRQM